MCVLPLAFPRDTHGLYGNFKEGSSCTFRLFSDEVLETSNLLGRGRDHQISTVALNDNDYLGLSRQVTPDAYTC